MIPRESINLREIYRYLGYRGAVPDERVCATIDEVLDELLEVISPKCLYQSYQCEITGQEQIRLIPADSQQILEFHSRQLADNLRGCQEVYLFAATLGVEADKLMQRYEVIAMAKASVLQSCAAACIETYCNLMQDKLRKEVSLRNLFLRPRFSPGYGDLPLTAQKDIFAALECAKRLGLTLTESLLMYPTKSVTAFIGVTENEKDCHIGKCSQCKNIECEFRYEE